MEGAQKWCLHKGALHSKTGTAQWNIFLLVCNNAKYTAQTSSTLVQRRPQVNIVAFRK